MSPPSMVACRLSMSRGLPHVSSVVGRVSESVIELPIVVLGRMSTRLVSHLPVSKEPCSR
jgi:hypothetical protein